MGFQFIPQLIETDLQVQNKEEVIRYLANKLQAHGFSNPSYADKVLMREQEYPTGLRTKCAAIAIRMPLIPESAGIMLHWQY